MRAIVLTAGYGRRMQPLSDQCHKALLPIAGGTMLGRIIDALTAIDVRDVIVVTGYRADDVTAYLRAGYPGMCFTFVHNERYAETNNIVSLSMALDRAPADDDLLLIECDLIFDPQLLRRLTGPSRGNIALVDRYRPGMDGTVVAVDDGVITHVYPPHLQGPEFSFTSMFKTLNIYRFDAAFCRTTLQPLLNCYANLIDSNCYYELVLGMLINMQRERIAAEVVEDDSWAEVDDPNDLAVAQFQFDRDRRAEILDRAMGGHWNFDVLDFAFMRNAHFPTDGMIAAIRQALPELLRSYGSTQAVLNQKLAYWLKCRPERLQVLHGASQIFPMLPDLIEPTAVALPAPTFGEYARAWPSAPTYRDDPDGGFDLEALDRLAGRVGAVVIVSPNSPTGHVVPAAWIQALAARRPSVRVIVDESFIDFSDQPGLVDLLEETPLPNLVVIRSLSKAFGVPGLRLGFVYSSDLRLVANVGDRVPVWNLSSPAEFFLELILKHRADFEASLRRTRDDRAVFAAALATSPLVRTVSASEGNFLLLRLRGSDPGLARDVRRGLLVDHGIDVKDVSGRFAPAAPCLRVAVRLPAENARLSAALEHVAAGLAG